MNNTTNNRICIAPFVGLKRRQMGSCEIRTFTHSRIIPP